MTRSDRSHPLIAARHFVRDCEILRIEPWGDGHINDTWRLRLAGRTDGLLQRINTDVFRNPVLLMENIQRVAAHIRGVVEAAGQDPTRRVLTVMTAADGANLFRDAAGDYWRCYGFIAGVHSLNRAENPGQIESAARAFARFQKYLVDLPGPGLHETIPGFGDTRLRLTAFKTVTAADPVARAAAVQREIDFVFARETLAAGLMRLLENGDVPERIIHFDTKLNNVLLDDETGEGLCVIDLDTVMPGTLLYDFGDLVRSGAARCLEDETDVSRAGIDLDLFAALVRGFLQEARHILVPNEIENLVYGARHVTFTMGLRFLSDHIDGDRYYGIDRPGQNLDRCRTQFAMLADMEAKAKQMTEIIAAAL
ncbi:MAG: aminoglycoside phosphotransferase family protein [bacterium]|nr:aminoglycoside phosphotransferase family protein [bacterium]